jgi:glycosyltransferase involved in cell wall biosynthesis
MSLTFGIITAGDSPYIKDCIESIRLFGSPDAEIIVVGGSQNASVDLCIPFNDEVDKPAWITRKKNLAIQNASHKNICLMHDYVSLCQGWQQGFDRFNNENPDWLTCINPIINLDGMRFRDWAEVYHDSFMSPPIDNQTCPEFPYGRLIDYDKIPNPRWQYYSGAYFCARKDVLLEVPFDERLMWGQGEDIWLSRSLYKRYGAQVFKLNLYSAVQFLKQKERVSWELPL